MGRPQTAVDPLFASSGTLAGSPGVGFATMAATAGDVNGDGHSDLIIGVPFGDGSPGRAYVYLGGPRPIPAAPARELTGDVEGGWFGLAVAAAGDVDGDGYGDLLVGAPARQGAGAAFLHRGSSAGTSPQASFRVEGTSGSGLGRSVATAGDVNGDGLADIIIGAPGFGGDSRGKAWLYLGSDEGETGLEAEPFWSREGVAGEAFGWAVATAGDVNGDGLADIVIGSQDSTSVSRGGRACLFLSRGDGFPQAPDWTLAGSVENELYGYSVGTAGDVDGDGFSDFLVGAPRPQGQGSAFLYAGGPGTISTAPAWSAGGSSGTTFAVSVATGGDVNGDGYADVLVGEPRHEEAGAGAGPEFDSGRVLVFLGSAAGLSAAPDRSLAGNEEGALLGQWVAPAGDLDGDGFGDILAAAPAKTFEAAGKVVVYHGAGRLPPLTPAWSAEGNAPDRSLGLGAIASAGDVNGDGFGDVIIAGGPSSPVAVALLFLGTKGGLQQEPERTFVPDQAVSSFASYGSAGSAGDVDGDGDDELFLCHSGRTGEFTGEGRVSLYSGGPAGLSERPTWVRDGGREGARFGSAADRAGDVNGDGYGDVVVSAIDYPDAEGRRVGAAFLFQGSPAGLSLTPSWTVNGEQTDSDFGFKVISAGDVNGDGYSDVLVGDLTFTGALPLEGKAYLYLGSAAGLYPTPAWTKTSGSANSRIGALGAGDFDGDGRSDLVLGGLFFSTTQVQVGRAWLYLGAAAGMGEDPAWSVDGDKEFARFAMRLHGAGDLDRDGRADVIIGEVGAGLVVDRPSRAFISTGAPGGLSATPAWVVSSPQPGDAFGHVGAAGDVNGDGFPDLLVGASRHDGPEVNEGKAYLFLGNGGGLPRRPRQLRTRSATPIVFLGRSDSSDSFRLAIDGRSPAGRDRVWLEWEVKPVGVPFDGSGLGRGAAPADTGTPAAGEGSVVELTEVAGGLAPDTPYKWRSRIAGRSPFFPRSPWLSLPYGNITEAKLRTAPAIPPVTNLLCEAVADGVEIRWQNGAAYEALELRRDGGATGALPGNLVSYFDPSPGTGRHEYALVGIQQGIRSPAAGCAATLRAVEALTVDFETEVVLTPDLPRVWFTFTPRAGSLLRLTLEDDDPADANALYARWAEPARASAFDHAAERRFQASQRMVVPSARAETLSVLAQANVFGGTDNVLRARVEEVEELALEGLSSRRAGAAESGQEVSAIVSGAGFEIAEGATTRFFLEERLEGGADGLRIEATDVHLALSSRAEVVFDLSGAPPGSYDLEAVKELEREPGDALVFRARLAAVFEVTPAARGPLLEVQVGGPRVTRSSRTTQLAVDYANVGDREMPAPLLLLTAPGGGELRLASDEEFRGRRLLVLGAPAGGLPDRLAPGASGSLPVLFRGTGCDPCTEIEDHRVSCCAGIEVGEFAPPRDAFVGWDRLAAPPGLEEGWESLRSPLSLLLGASWREFHQELARRARRLVRRGADPRSTLEPFRLAVREARGRPVGAIAGALRRAGSGVPEEGRLVAALSGGAVEAASRTDGQGRFLLEWIAEGKGHEVVVEGSAVVGTNRGTVTGAASVLLEVPRGEDVLDLELEVTAGETRGLVPACPGCDESGLPEEPPVPPAELFTAASRWEVGLVASDDPNEKGGSTGPDDLVGRRPVIHYTVYFENKPEAGAPAQGVRIIDRLDGDRLDLSTFRIGWVDLGSDRQSKSLSFPTEGYSAEARVAVLVPVTGGLGAALPGEGGGLPVLEPLDVTVKVGLDLRTGELVWEMQSLTEDVFQGFLHPNDASGRGQGSVSFTVSPRDEVSREDDIKNQAALRFDENLVVPTNEVTVPAALFFPEHEPRRPRPGDGAVDVAVGTGLCWEPVGRTERYEVAFGREGEQLAVAEVSEACFTPPPLAHAASYRWQVTAVSVSGRKTAGPLWRFTAEAPPPAPAGAAANPVPPDGSVEVSRETALSWTAPEPPAHSYAVYLWPAGDARPAAPLIADSSAARYQPPRLECGRSYLWQVASRSSPLVDATLGPQWRFTVRGHPFRRGDADASGVLDITDAINALGYLFTGGADPPCLEAVDADASDLLDITDPISILGFLFLGTPPPSAPFAACGCAPREGTLGCRSFPACP